MSNLDLTHWNHDGWHVFVKIPVTADLAPYFARGYYPAVIQRSVSGPLLTDFLIIR